MGKDIFVGLNLDDYIVKEPIKSGKVGSVYLAENLELQDYRAIKFIPKEKVDSKPSWQQEIIKVVRLKQTEGVVHFHKYGFIECNKKNYLYIMWEYIQSESLFDIIEKGALTMQMLVDVVERSLHVFHACKEIGVQHSDFHSGNILIQSPDPLSINSESRKVWITDFGYGTFSNETPPMDDYKGLARIIQQAIEKIDFHKLEKDERVKHKALKNEFPKFLHEENPTEGDYVRTPKKLLEILLSLFSPADDDTQYPKAVGDYLAAELIGERYDEWESLFVPKFLAEDDLLDRNICVLTGLRGCGKTMMFKRLSAQLVSKLGKAGIKGEDGFVGFYLNARNIAEAFPWLPDSKESLARKQVINYFHLRWTIEILEWLKDEQKASNITEVTWLVDFFSEFFKNNYITSTAPQSVLNSFISLCYFNLTESKLDNEYIDDMRWAFCEYDYIEKLLMVVSEHCYFAKDKSYYFFLDDYSTPMVTEATQRILNPIIFRRTSLAFFKVSTESIESFISTGLNGKVLEEGADYKLIELGIESINKNPEEIEDIITSIFSKRIERNANFHNKNIKLVQILGNTDISNNARAKMIRKNDKETVYYGVDVFCSTWSSDVRELIKIFSDMVSREGDKSISEKLKNGFEANVVPIISRKVQDNVFREAGGRFLHLLAVATSPPGSQYQINNTTTNCTYGAHLFDIVTAFQEIAYFDLKNKDSNNQGATPPKQARKIELKSANGVLDDVSKDYYRGLIRYGVFIQDYRAKSISGTVSIRLFLRGLLIPYCRLTFSKRDSITLDWPDFNKLLSTPKDFIKEYIKKNEYNPDQISFETFNKED